jgi:hypothetical protein
MSDTDSNGNGDKILNELLGTLQERLDKQEQKGRDDAITAVLNTPPRQTAVASLRESAVVETFREALVDGLIRVDTANRLLQLINDVIVKLIP